MTADQATSIFREITIGLKVSCRLDYTASIDEYSIYVPKGNLTVELRDFLMSRLRCMQIDSMGSTWQ